MTVRVPLLDVLLVDDEPLVLEGLKLMVDWEKRGFRVCGEATDGEEALAFIRKRCPHVVVTDIQMPGLGGLQLIEQSKQLRNAPRKFIILSGHEDFNFAQIAMRHSVSNYILKPIDEEEIDKVLLKLHMEIADEMKRTEGISRGRELWLNRAIQRMLGGKSDVRTLSCVKRLLGVGDREEIACIVVKQTGSKAGDSELRAWKHNVQAWLATHFPGQLLGLFADGIGQLALIVRGKAGSQQVAAGLLSNQSSLFSGSPIAVYASESRHGIEFIQDVYEQASGAQSKERDVDISDSDLKPLLQDIDNGRTEEIRCRVRELFVKFGERRTSMETVKLFVENLKLELMNMVSDMTADIHVFGPELLSLGSRERLESMPQLERQVLELCGYSALHVQEWRRTNAGNKMSQLIHYVNKHYNEKLQLQTVAEQFQLNPVYLGQLFKKTTGMPFNEYIHVKRIEEAKRLLRRPSMSISEVSGRIGYHDTDYFARKFKALTNELPSSYMTANRMESAKQPQSRRETSE